MFILSDIAQRFKALNNSIVVKPITVNNDPMTWTVTETTTRPMNTTYSPARSGKRWKK